ncbi:uracil-DNA glycosylase, partial [Duganella sp. FT80W]
APARPSPQGGQGPASRPSSRPAAPLDLAPLEDESTAWFDDAPMPPPAVAPVRPEPVSDEAIAQMDWDALRAAVSTCTRCTLCETRRAAVNGRGAERASWIAIATAPSQQDEEAGEPVTAEAGQLLNNMLKAIELKPDSEVYVATLVKCRPVDRSPSADEVIACRPFLERELALTGATMAMTFGQFAAKGLMMGPAARGKVMHYGANQLPVVATYHPDDLLRKPEDKAKAWADLCLAKASHA